MNIDLKYAGGGRHNLLTAGSPGDRLMTAVYPITFSNSYPTEGETFDFNGNGFFENVDGVIFSSHPTYHFAYIANTGKVKAYNNTDNSEVTSTTDLSGVTVVAIVVGQA